MRSCQGTYTDATLPWTRREAGRTARVHAALVPALITQPGRPLPLDGRVSRLRVCSETCARNTCEPGEGRG
jgi:hypothetical protein